MSLELRTLGGTGLRVSVVSLGGAFLDQIDPQQGLAVVRAALEAGINYLDTSPMYGRGRSQQILGQALADSPQPHLLATKLGYLPTVEEHRSLPALRRQLEDNLRILGRDHVDVLQIHEADRALWWTDGVPRWQPVQAQDHFDFADAPIMRVLHEARQRGLCRFIGLSGVLPDSLAHVMKFVQVDVLLAAYCYDLLHREALHQAWPLARQRNLGRIVGGVFFGGRLLRVEPPWLDHPPPWMTPDLQQRYRRLAELQAACGLPLTELGLRFLLADSSVDTMLLGAASPAELLENLRFVQAGPLPPDLHRAVEQLA